MKGFVIYSVPPKRSDPLPEAQDIARNARRLRIDGKNAAAWMIERMALELNLA